MKLEDYIRSVNQPHKRKASDTRFAAVELDHYNSISLGKKELIKDVFPYLTEDLFMDLIDRYERELSEYAYYLSRSGDGYMVLVRTKICNVVKDDIPKAISSDRFYADYNSRPKIGPQKYADVSILTYRDLEDSSKDRYMQIYYMEDGTAFLDSSSATTISKMSEDSLGRCLAHVCIECMEREQRGYSRVRE